MEPASSNNSTRSRAGSYSVPAWGMRSAYDVKRLTQRRYEVRKDSRAWTQEYHRSIVDFSPALEDSDAPVSLKLSPCLFNDKQSPTTSSI